MPFYGSTDERWQQLKREFPQARWERASIYALVSGERLKQLESQQPRLVPSSRHLGEWIESSWSHRDPDFAVVTYDEVFEHFGRWDAALFHCRFVGSRREYGRPSVGRLKLVRRVDQWSKRGLWRFCWREVRHAVADMHSSCPDDGRLMRAIIAAREGCRGDGGLIESRELARARRDAKSFYAQLPSERSGIGWLPVRWAAYAARATITLCSPNPENYPEGFTAMAAAQIAHDMRNQNNAAYISVKWLGVHRIVRFLRYLEIGQPWELAMVSESFWPDGRGRHAPVNLDLENGEPRVNFLAWETGARKGEPLRTDFYQGMNQLQAVQRTDGAWETQQDGIPADERQSPGLIMLPVGREAAC